ncbi:MAG: HEAT repeat domain-containing protein [Gemmataceae bacterium]|nr:HEAT repeat domain-containing protein [Gemmataceae bacterium]
MRFAVVCIAGFLFSLLLTRNEPSRGADDPYGSNVARTEPKTPAEEQKCFHLPPGFEIELVAAEPAIRKPINMNFDDRGRLWVTDSVEYPYAAPADKKPRDTVKVLESTKNDGVFDKVTTFADELNIPIGVLPVHKGAVVYSIPNIVRLTDTESKGQADKRDVLYGVYGHNDTHGMTGSFNWGFDGWIYAHHGFANTSTIKAADGSSIKMQSGNTYRIRPDGSRVEQFSWGQVNPFGLCFDPLGNLYSADCHSRPAMMLLRGAYYSSFGKPHDGLGYGPEMMTHDHGSTAICGIVYYAADQFPPEWRDTIFLGNVVTNRINHDRLERHGSSYKAKEQPDFLKCDDPWFRPVDIKLGPDGALYVADFYNRIIGHYEVPLNHPGRDRERGRIWRIVYRGPDKKGKAVQPRADWGKATIAELVSDLGHPNLTVRTIATNQLADRGGEAGVTALRALMKGDSTPAQRMHGIWALERRNALPDELLESAATDKDPGVRVHAMRVLSERKELKPAQVKFVHQATKDADPFVQRCAADALGRHPSAEHVRPLLDLRQSAAKDDALLIHGVRMALRDQLRPVETWKQLPANLSEADARALADVAPGVHTPEAAAFLLEHLQRWPESGPVLTRYVHQVARYGKEDVQAALLGFSRKNKPEDLRQQAAMFRAIQQGNQERGSPLRDEAISWAAALTGKLLASKDNDVVLTGIEFAGTLRLVSAQDGLVAMLSRRDVPEKHRQAAITALVAIQPKNHIPLLGKLLADAGEPAILREHAANQLAVVNQPESRTELLKALPTVPARLQAVIATGLASSPAGAEQLLEAVTAGKASARLLLDRGVEARLNQAKVPNLKERVAKLTRGLPTADQKMEELMKKRRTGFASAKTDAELGMKVFEKNCAACHQISGKGAKVGPQLDGVGIRGVDRLLEDVFDPNRNVDQAFRSTTLALTNGQIVQGLVLREEGEVIIVADAQGKEVRVPKKMIEERTVSQLSPMPANLVDQISEEDFYHLMAYLLAQRPIDKK